MGHLHRVGLSAVAGALLVAAPVFAQSAVDGFDPGAGGSVFTIAVQPDGKVLVGGTFTTLGGGGAGVVARSNIGRLNPDGSVDTGFDPGANFAVQEILVQPDGKIVVAGLFTMLGGGGSGTTPRARIGRLNPDGSIDVSFDPGASSTVHALALQADGKILVGGAFAALGGGGSGTTARQRIGRLNPDGSLDGTFDPGANASVHALLVQPDGRIVVGGDFTTFGGGGTGLSPRQHLARVDAAGVLDASFDPGVNGTVAALALQPDGRIVVGGGFTTLGGGGTGTATRRSIGRVMADGSLDASFDPGCNSFVVWLAAQPDGGILVGGNFATLGGGGTGTSTRNRIGRLRPDGALDPAFNPGADSTVNVLVVQPNGLVLVGGSFSALGGGSGTVSRQRIGRLYPDGSVETNFDPGANGSSLAIAVQPDGKILVGGWFTTLGGGGTGTFPRSRIGRLNPDGSLDQTFNPGADDVVQALAVQPDGKILVGGWFFTIGGGGTGTIPRSRIARLHPDGSVDLTFDPGADYAVRALIVQPDGKILVAGHFQTFGGGGSGTVPTTGVARLNPDGSLDGTFHSAAPLSSSFRTMDLQPDGKILLGSESGTLRLNADGSVDNTFTPLPHGIVSVLSRQSDGRVLVAGNPGLLPSGNIGRLHAGGTVDLGFSAAANEHVLTLAEQADGRVLVGGQFSALASGGSGWIPRSLIGRLQADGAIDLGFDPGASAPGGTGPGNQGIVHGIALQDDGKIIVGGGFATLGGGGLGTTPRADLGRLTPSAQASSVLRVSADGAVITWTRTGPLALLSRATFELSNDGVAYSPLGEGYRTADGWALSGQALPIGQPFFVRARGYYRTGLSGASGSLTESVLFTYLSSAWAAPGFAVSPTSQAVALGGNASFTAAATGNPAPTYRWQRSTNGGASWTDVPAVAPYSGVFTPTLTVTGASSGARFRAVATNIVGTSVSGDALLTVSATASTNLVSNSGFANGLTNWLLWATPTVGHLVASVTNGVLEFSRLPPPPGTQNQAVVFQETGIAVPANAPVVATFSIGNSSSVRKRISVVVHDASFQDLNVCTFWLGPNTPRVTYGIELHTTQPWTNAAISFYAASVNAAGDSGAYLVDDVSLQFVPTGDPLRTRCLDPTAPAAPGGVDSADLLVNGDFSSGGLAPGWSTFGQIAWQVASGVFEFLKLPGEPAGVVLQATGQTASPGELLSATFALGNSSAVRKRVTVILHDNDFSDLSACTFWLAPGQPLTTYRYLAFATQGWANATLSFYPSPIGPEPWIRLDDVSLRRTPASVVTGTECLEPGAVPDVTADVPPNAAAVEAAPGGIDQRGWRVVAETTAVRSMLLADRLEVPPAGGTQLAFRSWLIAIGSRARVECSVDGVTWQTLAVIGPSDTWMPIDLDLTDYAGLTLLVRLVFDGRAPSEPTDVPDTWLVEDLEVVTPTTSPWPPH